MPAALIVLILLPLVIVLRLPIAPIIGSMLPAMSISTESAANDVCSIDCTDSVAPGHDATFTYDSTLPCDPMLPCDSVLPCCLVILYCL
jgi:hypothetical protein